MNWLAPKLHLRVAQKQILTPGLVQMVSVLALNRLELREMINQEMVENPVLEELSDDPVVTEDYSAEAFLKAETEKVPEIEPPSPFAEFDVASFFNQYLGSGGGNEDRGEREVDERPSFEQFLSSAQGLSEHLTWQLSVTVCNDIVREIADAIIGNLDENGYLSASLEEISQNGKYSLEDVEEALQRHLLDVRREIGRGDARQVVVDHLGEGIAGHLAERIESVVKRAGLEIPQSRMFVMNASSKLKAVNAYASGLGATKRVVVWDTSIQRMTEDEILFVFGHEMGHYVLGHVRNGILFFCGVLLFFLFLAYHILHWMLARWGETWSIRGTYDLASLPALILLLTVFGFLFTPISNAYSRYLEHQADQYGLEVIHGLVPDAPVVAAHAFQVLGEVDLEEPNPSTAVKFWFYNHPPLDERMRFAQTYDPWSEGRAPEFVK